MKSKLTSVSCEDCYFRRASLCALDPDTPCPTFRHVSRGSFAPAERTVAAARPVVMNTAREHELERSAA